MVRSTKNPAGLADGCGSRFAKLGAKQGRLTVGGKVCTCDKPGARCTASYDIYRIITIAFLQPSHSCCFPQQPLRALLHLSSPPPPHPLVSREHRQLSSYLASRIVLYLRCPITSLFSPSPAPLHNSTPPRSATPYLPQSSILALPPSYRLSFDHHGSH
jgi:hypothetical protein